ncbi:MAG: UvrB/UvrC motif-containing protein [Candidatus Zambryskibacteria bacterium]|nr:UvrB/UvrC motif-containing protein [Candidatus Zambryskibacteria bacterium]
MKLLDLKQFNLPDTPGVYYFKKKKEILYVGKATSLKDRVKSYFSKDLFLTRGPKIVKMLEEVDLVDFKETDSVLEALILEANEIKRLQPAANSRDKDDKSYNYVVVTKEDFPRIVLVRGRELLKIENLKLKIAKQFGPFPHAGELREALKIVRRIFSFRDVKCKMGKPCFNAQIGLCPGPCGGWISKEDYKKIIKNFVLFFEGKKGMLIKSLENEMKLLAKQQKFEEAERVKRQLFSLDHIQDIALIKRDIESQQNKDGGAFRIEAYDIAHISGTNVVGVMTVVEDGEVNKSQYRKFKIKTDNPPSHTRATPKAPTRREATVWQGNDDVGNLKHVLSRRLDHPEWRLPDLIVIDGGIGQLNAARAVIEERNLNIKTVAVVKDQRHKAKEILGFKGPTLSTDSQGRTLDRAILLANSEAHRFAINYHRLLRSKGFRI